MQRKMKLTSRLGLVRQAAGFSQAEAAIALSVVQPMISAWERGKDVPSEPRKTQLARLYGVSVAVVAAASERDSKDYVRRLSNLRRNR
jgi:transcriptional regulator with XRE-family HTH domain